MRTRDTTSVVEVLAEPADQAADKNDRPHRPGTPGAARTPRPACRRWAGRAPGQVERRDQDRGLADRDMDGAAIGTSAVAIRELLTGLSVDAIERRDESPRERVRASPRPGAVTKALSQPLDQRCGHHQGPISARVNRFSRTLAICSVRASRRIAAPGPLPWSSTSAPAVRPRGRAGADQAALLQRSERRPHRLRGDLLGPGQVARRRPARPVPGAPAPATPRT